MNAFLLQIPLLDTWILPDSWGALGGFIEGALIILISFIFGYLIRRWVNMSSSSNLEMTISALEDELARLKAENRDLKATISAGSEAKAQLKGLQADLDACKKSRLQLDDKINSLQAQLTTAKSAAAAAPTPQIPPAPQTQTRGLGLVSDAAATPPAAPAPIPLPKGMKRDDLKVVEGIGPKIEKLLHAENITTWALLSATDPARIKDILLAAGPRYRIHDPSTWPQQADLAHHGKWEELDALQDKLKGGKVV